MKIFTKYMTFSFFLILSIAVSAAPSGRYANLNDHPSCDVYFHFQSQQKVIVSEKGKSTEARWSQHNNIVTIEAKKWKSFFRFDQNRLTWTSFQSAGQTQDVSKNLPLEKRSFTPCP